MSKDMKERYLKWYTEHEANWVNWGRAFYNIIPALNIKTVCDVGCGDGSFPYDMVTKFAADKAYGLDIAHVALGKVKQHPKIEYFDNEAKDIPLEDNSVEWITSFDVLEHIPEEEIDVVLDEFSRVASVGWLLTISNKESSEIDDQGNLHVLVQTPEWWFTKLSKYGAVTDITDRPSKNSKYQVELYKN